MCKNIGGPKYIDDVITKKYFKINFWLQGKKMVFRQHNLFSEYIPCNNAKYY